MTHPPLPTLGRLQRRLTIIGLVGILLCAVRADAGVTTINNVYESTDAFLTEVIGSVGFFLPISILSDIPGTPWVSTSRIVEVPGVGPFPDAMSVSWTIQHLVGPDPTDINPNPLEPITLTLGFIATAAGSFGVGVGGGTPPISCLIVPPAGSVIDIQTVNHPLTTGGVHFDEFCLNLFGTINTNLVGGLRIVNYEIDYIAYHCDVLDPTLVGCPATLAGIGGMTPAPSTLVLVGLGFGLGILIQVNRRRRRTPGGHAIT